MRAWLVPPRIVDKAWPRVEDWVKVALARGNADMTAADVREHLHQGSMQLWLAWDDEADRAHGCCITEVTPSPRGKRCNLVVVAGENFKMWRPLTKAVKTWARGMGCVRLEAGGREGWQRLVKEDGWQVVRVVIEMRL